MLLKDRERVQRTNRSMLEKRLKSVLPLNAFGNSVARKLPDVSLTCS